MAKGEWLGEFEQVVLLAVAHQAGEGYGLTIREEIETRTGREVTVGAVYGTLARLEEKGLVVSRQGEATARRGGRSRRHYALTPSGRRALAATRRLMDRMWEGADEVLRPGRA